MDEPTVSMSCIDEEKSYDSNYHEDNDQEEKDAKDDSRSETQ